MNNQTKICQNCKQSFTIEPEDFQFYKKMEVPPPTFCPECRFQRRTMFRNERVLYKRTCDLCNKNIISVFPENAKYKVFCSECWWSDAWDPTEYSRPYDPQKPFFLQLKELRENVPHPSLIIDYPTLVNSEYVNHTGNCKNVYLMFDTDFCENASYGTTVVETKDSLDLSIVRNSELCYELINCERCYRTFFSEDCIECQDVIFSKNLVSCSDCFGCVNLKNKKFHIFNIPHTKEDYYKELEKYSLHSFQSLKELKKRVVRFWNEHPSKYMRGRLNVRVSGDYVYNSKNCSNVFQVMNVEDSKFCCRMATINSSKEAYDYFEWGNNAERIYECTTVGQNAQNIRFCNVVFNGVSDIEYSFWIMSSSNLFGCVGLRSKSYCILNKQYTKEDFHEFRKKIIKDMVERPYTDAKGRVFSYGEFFPYELSAFGYNESTAMQYIPIDKQKTFSYGWEWRDVSNNQYSITKQSEMLCDNIQDETDSILKEIIACSECGRAYRIIPMEFEFLKRHLIALPRKCSECRHKERFSRISPPKLWKRNCAKCDVSLETSYPPESPAIVYCEQCYQKEIV